MRTHISVLLAHRSSGHIIYAALLALMLVPMAATGQTAPRYIAIGRDGVMRWVETGRELTGFGVNYTVPFAHAYRKGKEMGLDLKAEIDRDVYHFARLGLDLFRVHVWDCEISDTLGNLLDNEHLELFDYLLFKLREHGIKSMITPIAYWGNGWPDPDEPTPGFSTKYGKAACLTDPAAIEAQKRYLGQFLNHVNRYTGQAYKFDPNILLVEISNEPHHREEPEKVRAFINIMSKAIRDAGCIKPVFYNVTHSIHLAEAYAGARIDGGTFQWYPTGLGFQKPLQGNMLPHVDKYDIPFDALWKQKGLARIVYEFDAADMDVSYMYPAMARSFRTAGMQLATHFSYDPTFLAPYNTEYNTHYMNLLYAPRKALALMISAEIFRQIPLYANYGRYPDNTRFGPFRIDAETDLAELVTEEKFYYTHHTQTTPPAPDKLMHIAGWGDSPVVEYDGTGAYFLDKLEDGAWVLEVYPDAAVTDNLFGRNNTDTPRSTILPDARKFRLLLPGFEDYFVIDLRTGMPVTVTDGAAHPIAHGRYLLVTAAFDADDEKMTALGTRMKAIPGFRDSYPLPPVTLPAPVITASPTGDITAGRDLTITARIITPTLPGRVDLVIQAKGNPVAIPMLHTHGHQYTAVIPAKQVTRELTGYQIQVSMEKVNPTFQNPVPAKAKPITSAIFPLTAVKAKSGIILLDPATDMERINRQWSRDIDFTRTGENADDPFRLEIRQLLREDPENLTGTPVADFSIRHAIGDRIAGRRGELAGYTHLEVDVSSPAMKPLQVAIVQDNGVALGMIIQPEARMRTFRIPLSELRPVDYPLLPRPYPTFLPYYFPAVADARMDLSRLESVLLSFGPGLRPGEYAQTLTWEIGRVRLVR